MEVLHTVETKSMLPALPTQSHSVFGPQKRLILLSHDKSLDTGEKLFAFHTVSDPCTAILLIDGR